MTRTQDASIDDDWHGRGMAASEAFILLASTAVVRCLEEMTVAARLEIHHETSNNRRRITLIHQLQVLASCMRWEASIADRCLRLVSLIMVAALLYSSCNRQLNADVVENRVSHAMLLSLRVIGQWHLQEYVNAAND